MANHIPTLRPWEPQHTTECRVCSWGTPPPPPPPPPPIPPSERDQLRVQTPGDALRTHPGWHDEAGADDEARRVPGYHRPAAGTGRTRGPLVWLGFGKVGTDCHAEWAAAIWRFYNVCRSLPVSYTVRQTTAPRVIKPLTERDLGATQQQRLAATTRPGSPSFFSVFVCALAAAAAADGERHRQQGTSRRQQHGHGRTRTGYR